jgi:5-hydroxyisourate hydrolase-like protein (transthyretin family)
MKKIIKLLFNILILLSLVFSISAITITSGTFYSNTSNTTLIIGKPINTSEIILSDNYIYLQNFTFESGDSWINATSELEQNQINNYNLSTSNLELNTSNFLHYFRFSYNSTLLSDYSFNSINSLNEELVLFYSDLGVEGVKNWFWQKIGYVGVYLGFNFSYDAYNNITFDVTRTTLTLNVKDELTNLPIFFNITINNGTTITSWNNINGTFSADYQDLPVNSLKITVSASNYNSRNLYTNLTEYTSITEEIFLLNSNLSQPVIFRVLDASSNQPVESVIISAYKIINNTNELLGQAQTDSNGYTYINLDYTSGDYELILTKNGYVTEVINSIPYSTEYLVLMRESGANINYNFENVAYEFFPYNNYIYNFTTAGRVRVIDSDNLITQSIITITGFKAGNISYYAQSIDTDANGQTYNFVMSNVSDYYLYELEILRDGQWFNFSKTYNYINSSNYYSIEMIAQDLDDSQYNGWKVFIVVFGYLIVAGLGAALAGEIGAAIFGTVALVVFMYGGLMPYPLGAVMIVFSIVGAIVLRRI